VPATHALAAATRPPPPAPLPPWLSLDECTGAAASLLMHHHWHSHAPLARCRLQPPAALAVGHHCPSCTPSTRCRWHMVWAPPLETAVRLQSSTPPAPCHYRPRSGRRSSSCAPPPSMPPLTATLPTGPHRPPSVHGAAESEASFLCAANLCVVVVNPGYLLINSF
jgi:hypothetical protein